MTGAGPEDEPAEGTRDEDPAVTSRAEIVPEISTVDAARWNRLAGTANPFITAHRARSPSPGAVHRPFVGSSVNRQVTSPPAIASPRARCAQVP